MEVKLPVIISYLLGVQIDLLSLFKIVAVDESMVTQFGNSNDWK